MFRRANGSFRYKRNVPKDLRTVIPKATVYRQLENSFEPISAQPSVAVWGLVVHLWSFPSSPRR
jgi:hypothetical protein